MTQKVPADPETLVKIKNVSLLGGLMIASVDTEGKPPLGWRGRRAERKVQTSIAAALPLVAS
nr:hypothetical protein [Rhodococcus qingshengii]